MYVRAKAVGLRLVVVGGMLAVCVGLLPGPAAADITAPRVSINPQGDPCTTVPADQIFYAPAGWTGGSFTSGSGFYGYRQCDFWLLDLKMATYSACSVPDLAFCWSLRADASAFDLPSSGAANVQAALPKNADDCNRYLQWVRIYKQAATDASFVLLYEEDDKGIWTGATCSRTLTHSQGSPPHIGASASGWDTYRIAASVKLRTSFQEAGVDIFEVVQ